MQPATKKRPVPVPVHRELPDILFYLQGAWHSPYKSYSTPPPPPPPHLIRITFAFESYHTTSDAYLGMVYFREKKVGNLSTTMETNMLAITLSGRFGTLKSDSTHHFFRNACTKSGSLRFSQFSGCWLILSVYILMSFDFPFVRLFGVR